ncbi:MAG: hypothetical protein GY757_35740 [bacterium]|nr:hypothetical protein [bacterium]
MNMLWIVLPTFLMALTFLGMSVLAWLDLQSLKKLVKNEINQSSSQFQAAVVSSEIRVSLSGKSLNPVNS